MLDLIDRFWPIAEPVLTLLALCALAGGVVGGVYGLIQGFLGD